jgi:hypothetical protein
MIIWGSCSKQKTVDRVDFYCLKCRADAVGEHIRVSRYFTLYFIPLFPTSTLGAYICCEDCQGEYNTEVLDISREEFEAAQSPWKCDRCGNSNPPEYKKCLSCRSPRLEDDVFIE